MVHFADAFAVIRKARGDTVQHAARICGVTPDCIKSWTVDPPDEAVVPSVASYMSLTEARVRELAGLVVFVDDGSVSRERGLHQLEARVEMLEAQLRGVSPRRLS